MGTIVVLVRVGVIDLITYLRRELWSGMLVCRAELSNHDGHYDAGFCCGRSPRLEASGWIDQLVCVPK